jgi:hypothetical protein
VSYLALAISAVFYGISGILGMFNLALFLSRMPNQVR